jgi:hypothetical protein
MKVLVILSGFIPSTIIGVLRPLVSLEKLKEIKLHVVHSKVTMFIDNEVEWCDIAVFCRNCEISDLSILYKLKTQGKKVVYEIDDNFEEIPLSSVIGRDHRYFSRLHVLKRFFQLSDVTRVYSNRLMQRAALHGARTQLIRSYFDKKLIDLLNRTASSGKVKIAYPTGRIDHNGLEDKIFSAVKYVLQKHPGLVEFHLWRSSTPKLLIGMPGVVLNKGSMSYDKFVKSFYTAGFDIGLAPGIDIPFFHSKTNNKYREFGGCGVAGIYSNFPPYAGSIVHEETGLLTGDSSSEWEAAIERLVFDRDLRLKIVANAKNDIFLNYSFEQSVESWRDCFSSLKYVDFSVPEWIPVERKLTKLVFLSLQRKMSTFEKTQHKRRYEYLKRAIKCLPKVVLISLTEREYLLRSSYDESSVVAFINNEQDFHCFLGLIELANSAIIDLTTYRGDVFDAVRILSFEHDNLFKSVLVSHDHADLAVYNKKNLEILAVEIDSLSEASQLFSLNRYPATYLYLSERHLAFAPIKMKSMLFGNSSTLSRLLIMPCMRIWQKGRTFLIAMMWRLGFRRT